MNAAQSLLECAESGPSVLPGAGGGVAAARHDRRLLAAGIALVAVLAGGALIAGLSDGGWWQRIVKGSVMPERPAMSEAVARKEIHERFQQGVVMLHAKQFEHAMTAFHRVLQLDPDMPEAYVNTGFALIGLQRFDVARDFFNSALALRREQTNAYYGLALALNALQDRPGAIGAMRTYVHLSKPDAPHTRKAALALREWEGGAKRAKAVTRPAAGGVPTAAPAHLTGEPPLAAEPPIEQP